MNCTLAKAVCGLLLASLTPAVLAAQAPPAGVCPGCTLEIEEIRRIGAADGAGSLPGRFASVAMDSRRRLWASFSRGELLVFDTAGKLAGTVGRRGQGPGEFAGGSLLLAAGDSMLVLDNGNMRLSVAGPDLRISRSVRLPGPVTQAVVVRWPDQVVLNGFWPQRQDGRTVLHAVDVSGPELAVVRSFGDAGQGLRPGAAAARFALAATPDGSVWAGGRTSPSVHQWRHGERVRGVQRRPGWLAAGDEASSRNAELSSLRVDEAGRLWAFSLLPAPGRAAAWRAAAGGGTGRGAVGEVSMDRAPPPEQVWDMAVTVLDPSGEHVLATRAVTQLLVPLGDDLVAAYAETLFGVPQIVVLRVGLR